MRAIIVGGGIGGLSAACALVLHGWQVELLEQAPALEEVGAGLQISPNGTRVLEALGVMEALTPVLFEPENVELRLGQSGRIIFRIPMKRIARRRWGARYFQVHRADLVEVLRARLAALQPDAIRLGVRIDGYRQQANGIVALTSEGETERADLLIGADGIRSAVKRQMLGDVQPQFTGNVAWRAVVPTCQLTGDAPPPSGVVWAGAGRHAVTTYLRAGSLVNFVGIVEQNDWREEGWHHPGNPEQAKADFQNWHPCIAAILDQVGSMHRWALFDHAKLPRWSDGRAVLLGDAAHPMLPSMAQGAVMALEDAWVLARTSSNVSDPVDAANRYYETRIARVTAVQRRSAANAKVFHLPNALVRSAAYAPLWVASRIAPGALQGLQDRIYFHDVTA